MPSPFPGMDPYLERSRWFRGLHNDLITFIQEAIQPLLPSPYFALMGELIWMEGSERYIEPDVDVLRLSSARRREEWKGARKVAWPRLSPKPRKSRSSWQSHNHRTRSEPSHTSRSTPGAKVRTAW